MGQAGPLPHRPKDGKIVAFGPRRIEGVTLGSGAPLIVDVEFGHGLVYAFRRDISRRATRRVAGDPNTGALLGWRRTARVVVDKLNQPTSLEFIGDTAYVVTLGGEIWKIEDVAQHP